MKSLKIICGLIIFTLIFSCTKSKPTPEWMQNKNLSAVEIIEHIKQEIDQAKSFKYTSEIKEDKKMNTFLFDKKGNALSIRGEEQIFQVNGKVYVQENGGEVKESPNDSDYFTKNMPYIKQNGAINVEMIKNCKITTSVEGDKLTIKTTDFGNIDAKDADLLTDLTITYIPNNKSITELTYGLDGKKYVRTYSFYCNPEELVKLP